MHDLFIQIIFYLFSGIALLSAVMVITQNNPVRCVLFLVLTFFAVAVLWIMAEAEFLALILVLVYVGAVMTLFLFVVMMLDIDVESIRGHFARYLPFGLILVALLVSLLIIAIPENMFNKAIEKNTIATLSVESEGAQEEDDNYISSLQAVSNTEKIGLALYTDYVVAFEIAAVLLLVAIIAAITLAQRGIVRSKRQDITKQIMTRREDRIRLIKMESEK